MKQDYFSHTDNKEFVLISIYASYLILVLFNFRIPFGVLAGPITYYFLTENVGLKKFSLHLLPFIFILILKFYMKAYIPDITQDTASYMFYNSVCAFISCSIYSFILLRNFPYLSLTATEKMFGRQLLLGLLATGVLFFFILLYKFGVNIDFVIAPMSILYAINLAMFLLSIVYFSLARSSNNKLSKSNQIELIDPSVYTLSSHSQAECAILVQNFFKSSTAYLDPNFCLDDLSSSLELPRHTLSSCFSNHFNMNFYNLVSCYRIQHALLLYKNSPNLSWDSIALDCGYFSRTSFNKHFKKNTGLLPSEMTKEYIEEFFNEPGIVAIDAYSNA